MAFLIGWPAVALALAFSVFGILYRMPAPLVGTAILITPFSLYLAATPRFPWCIALPLIPLLAAFALKKGRRNLAIVLTVVVFGFFAWLLVLLHQAKNHPTPAPEPIAADAEFWFSSDPDSEIVYVHIWGGTRPDSFTYELFGDGRLVRTLSTGPNSDQDRAREVRLSRPEVEDILSRVVEAGAMAWDPDQIQQRMIEIAGGVWKGSPDSRSVRIRVTLESYSNSPSTRYGPVSKEIQISGLPLMHRRFPEIGEIVALDDLQRTLSGYFATEEDPNEPMENRSPAGGVSD